jgi:PDZ domain-containing protein
VGEVDAEGPSEGKLEPDDEIVSVNGREATSAERVARVIGASEPGDEVVFELRRAGKSVEATVTSEAADDDPEKARVGITLGESVQGEDITVTYGLKDVGGPSAGLMFSLGIIDELTRQSLTDGKAIAGTGTIDAEGLVGPIGGVQQKVVGAKRDGAEYFLTPLLNCRDAAAAAPEGLQLVRVDNLQDAVDALEAIREGDDFPRC